MWLFLDQYDQVTRRTASLSGITTTAYVQLHTFLHTCWYIDAYRFFSIYSSFSFASRTLSRDCRPFTIASRTSSHRLHLAKKSILYSSYLSTSATSITCLNATFILRPTSTACITTNMFLHLDIL